MPNRRFASSNAWFALAFLLVGALGIAAAWILFAVSRDQQMSWMAIVAALDAAVLLRLARVPSGWPRALCGVIATLATIFLANWGITAVQIGQLLGLLPWESAMRLGDDYARTLIALANGPADLAWLTGGLIVAAVASR